MLRFIRWTIVAVLAGATPSWAADKYAIKLETAPVPKELKESIGKLLGDRTVQLLDDKGNTLCEIWFRKELPSKATPAQVKNGLTYRELEETTIVGAVRLAQPMTDYRKQKIKTGVYTLRLGFQPMDGDHMGTAPYGEFCLLIPADADGKAEVTTAKELQELSTKASGTSHPAVFLLFPNEKPEDAPKLTDKGKGAWVLFFKEPVLAGSEKASIGFGLTLIGHSEG
jgi:hypothetical protein